MIKVGFSVLRTVSVAALLNSYEDDIRRKASQGPSCERKSRTGIKFKFRHIVFVISAIKRFLLTIVSIKAAVEV